MEPLKFTDRNIAFCVICEEGKTTAIEVHELYDHFLKNTNNFQKLQIKMRKNII